MEKGKVQSCRAGPFTQVKSAPIILEGELTAAGAEQGEVLQMIQDGQKEQNGILRDIRDELRLWNNLMAFESFGRLDYGAELWPGGRFAEWFVHWCHEDLSSVAETTRQQTEEQARLAQEVLEVRERREAEGSGRD